MFQELQHKENFSSKFTDKQATCSCVFFVRDMFDSQLLQKSVTKIDLSKTGLAFDACTEKLTLEEHIAQVKSTIVFCVTSCVRMHIAALESLGYELISTKIELEYVVHKQHGETLGVFTNSGSSGYEIISGEQFSFDQQDIRLQHIIFSLAQTSHYSKNPKISHEQAYDLYMQWVYNAWHGYASKIFVAVIDESKIAGFISLKETGDEQKSLSIDLLAVHEDSRKMGIAQALISKACNFAQKEKKTVYVGTQAENIPAVRLYEKMGFIQKSFNLVYHKIIK